MKKFRLWFFKITNSKIEIGEDCSIIIYKNKGNFKK